MPLKALRMTAVGSVLLMAVATAAFFEIQNRMGLLGGQIAWSKSVWLGCAILFWLVLPALIAGDARLPTSTKRPFVWLLGLMGARALIEPLMLYQFKNWLPAYGVMHDVLCLAVLWGWCALDRLRPHHLMRCHAFFTGALFIPEMFYAVYMQTHFATRGDQAIYFVPDDGSHALALGVTAAVDAIAVVYLVFFLSRWLYVSPDRTHS
jgi:hypothetical protein